MTKNLSNIILMFINFIILCIFCPIYDMSFLAYFYYQSVKQVPADSYAEIQCPLGVRTKFYLPDGTTGYLNSGSLLKYPVKFNN